MGFIPPNQLPEESIETDAFYNSYSNKNDCSYSEAVSASNTSRCFSSFNQSDAESAPQEVSTAKKYVFSLYRYYFISVLRIHIYSKIRFWKYFVVTIYQKQ
jgi:hypothetical protein